MKCTCGNRDSWHLMEYKMALRFTGRGYSPNKSKSSLVLCTKCLNSWRTTASYIEQLEKKYPTPYLCKLDGRVWTWTS